MVRELALIRNLYLSLRYRDASKSIFHLGLHSQSTACLWESVTIWLIQGKLEKYSWKFLSCAIVSLNCKLQSCSWSAFLSKWNIYAVFVMYILWSLHCCSPFLPHCVILFSYHHHVIPHPSKSYSGIKSLQEFIFTLKTKCPYSLVI
jgi:hypothetical protein